MNYWQIQLLDFGNGRSSDNIILQIDNGTLQGIVFKGTNNDQNSISTLDQLIKFNEWYHIAFVVENSIGFLYLNGKQQLNQSINMPDAVIRKMNTIGASPDIETSLDISIDDLKIFEGALLPEEVHSHYDSGKLFSLTYLMD